MAAKKQMAFEEALEKLEQASENLKKDNITLKEALENFEQGVAYYNQCSEILNNAKQKIETWNK